MYGLLKSATQEQHNTPIPSLCKTHSRSLRFDANLLIDQDFTLSNYEIVDMIYAPGSLVRETKPACLWPTREQPKTHQKVCRYMHNANLKPPNSELLIQHCKTHIHLSYLAQHESCQRSWRQWHKSSQVLARSYWRYQRLKVARNNTVKCSILLQLGDGEISN